MSHVDYIDAFRERSNRLLLSYTKDGKVDNQGLVHDLFSALFYAKLEGCKFKESHKMNIVINPKNIVPPQMSAESQLVRKIQ